MRVTTDDLARAAGVSRSTVDRVLTGRASVSPMTADRVLAAADRIGFYGTNSLRIRLQNSRTFNLAILLQQSFMPFYRRLAEALEQSTKAARDCCCKLRVEFSDDLRPAQMAARLEHLGERADAVAICTADHPLLNDVTTRLADRGTPVFTVISDLSASQRVGYIGVDNRQFGRTAAWFITRLSQGSGEIGILVGNHRYLCQETREIAFRGFLREHAAGYVVLEPIQVHELDEHSYDGVVGLLKRHPNLTGLFVNGAGIGGALQALREHRTDPNLVVVAVEVTEASRAALLDGTIDVILTHPLQRIADVLVTAMLDHCKDRAAPLSAHRLLPFDVIVSENT